MRYVYLSLLLFQKLHARLPLNVEWMLKLSRNQTARAVLRLFLVSLCILITLIMAILNFVSIGFFC